MFKNIVIFVALVALTSGNVIVKNTTDTSVESTNEFKDSSNDGIFIAKTESKESNDDINAAKTQSKEINQSEEAQSDNEPTEDTYHEKSSKENDIEELTSEELAEKQFRELAEADVKNWIENLNCYKTRMGPIKCFLIKKVCRDYYSSPSPSRDPEMMIYAAEYLVTTLKNQNKIDPELQILIDKYGDYFNKD